MEAHRKGAISAGAIERNAAAKHGFEDGKELDHAKLDLGSYRSSGAPAEAPLQGTVARTRLFAGWELRGLLRALLHPTHGCIQAWLWPTCCCSRSSLGRGSLRGDGWIWGDVEYLRPTRSPCQCCGSLYCIRRGSSLQSVVKGGLIRESNWQRSEGLQLVDGRSVKTGYGQAFSAA